MNKTTEQVRQYIKETGILQYGDHILVCVSGGADSVFLLRMLHDLSREEAYVLRVIHIHHGIRGDEADRDAEFTRLLSEDLGIPFQLVRKDVPRIAKERKLSLEEAGREVRHAAFREAAILWEEETGISVKTALAHHRDDQAETLLFRMARGTSLRGLAGIPPMDGRLVRPLLALGREEIRDALRGAGYSYCEDSTNAEDDAARNRIRHHVLPCLEEEVNSCAAAHLSLLAGDFASCISYIDGGRRKKEKELFRIQEGGSLLIKEELLSEHPFMQAELVRAGLETFIPGLRNIGRIQITEVQSLFRAESGKQLSLPKDLRAVRKESGVLLTKGKTVAETPPKLPEVRMDLLDAWPDPVPNLSYTKWLDYDKMNRHMPVIRHRMRGDYIVIDSAGHRKSLSDEFTDRKIPKELRNRIPLAAIGSEILWIIGGRISRRYYIDEGTQRVLRLSVTDIKS